MKFKYNGEKGNMMGVFGYDFSDHKVVDVDNPFVIEKLKGNSHFDVVSENIETIKPKKTEKPEFDLTDSIEKSEPKKSGKFGLFRIKSDGGHYSKPDKIFGSMEDVEKFMDYNGINPEERIILEKA